MKASSSLVDDRWAGIGTLISAPLPVAPAASTPLVTTAAHDTQPAQQSRWRPHPAITGLRAAIEAVRRRWILVLSAAAISVTVLVVVIPRLATVTAVFGLAASALIVSACGVISVRVCGGRMSEVDPASQVERRLGILAVNLSATDSTVALSMLPIASLLRGHPRVNVVQLTHPERCDLSIDLDHAADLLGVPRMSVDITEGSEAGDERAAGPFTVGLRTQSLKLGDVSALSTRRGPAVLVVDTATARWPEVLRTKRVLDAIGSDVVAVAIWCGRVPVDPAHRWNPDASA